MINYSKVHSKVKPFCIYFPQFHTLPENNKKGEQGDQGLQRLAKHQSNQLHTSFDAAESQRLLGSTHRGSVLVHGVENVLQFARQAARVQVRA